MLMISKNISHIKFCKYYKASLLRQKKQTRNSSLNISYKEKELVICKEMLTLEWGGS